MGLFDFFKKNNSKVVWRNSQGNITCPGDACKQKDCDETCPIFLNTLAVQTSAKRAILLYKKALEIAPDFYDGWNNLGARYGEIGDYQNAYDCYKKARELNKIKPNPVYGLMLASRDLGKYEEFFSWCDIYKTLSNDGREEKIKEEVEKLLSSQTKSSKTSKKRPKSAEESFISNQYDGLFRDVTQDVAINMMNLKITQRPILRFFHNDMGLLSGLYAVHAENPQYLAIKKEDENTYALICGMHALGAGAYATLMQVDFKKPIDQWDLEEFQKVANELAHTDAYELALKKLGFSPTGNNKRVLDNIILEGLESTKSNSNTQILTTELLKVYMQAMFNAGITLVLRD